MLKGPFRIGLIQHLLSVDVVAGACITAYALGLYRGHMLPFTEVLLLGNAVWIIYTTDHLYDAWFAKGEAASMRRSFHIRYRKMLIILLCIAVIAELVLLFSVQLPVWKMGLPAFVLTVAYLALNWISQRRRRNFYLKEVMLAAGYSAGILVLPIVHEENEALLRLYAVPAVFIFMAALANVCIIALYGMAADRSEQQVSAGNWMRPRWLKMITGVCLFMMLALSFCFIFPVSLLMVAQLAAVLFIPRYFARRERYRAWADGVFLLPALFLIYRLFC